MARRGTSLESIHNLRAVSSFANLRTRRSYETAYETWIRHYFGRSGFGSWELRGCMHVRAVHGTNKVTKTAVSTSVLRAISLSRGATRSIATLTALARNVERIAQDRIGTVAEKKPHTDIARIGSAANPRRSSGRIPRKKRAARRSPPSTLYGVMSFA
jgi:hypothetical protein